MQNDCAVNCDHIQTVAKGRVGGVVTRLSPAHMRAVARAIAFTLNLGGFG